MPIKGLTQAQSDFLERFVRLPEMPDDTSSQDRRRDAIAQVRVVEAGQAAVREEILEIEDAGIKSALLLRLEGVDAALEPDPGTLDVEAAEAHLTAVQAIARRHTLQEQAQAQFEQLSDRVAAVEALEAPGDIAHVWAYAQTQFEAGVATGSTQALDAVLGAMARLEQIVVTAEKAAQNPFSDPVAQTGSVEADAQAAQRRLQTVFDDLTTLNETLADTFGEQGVPLSLRLALSGVRNKLNAAAEAAPSKLQSLAEDVETEFALARRAASALIAQAQGWAREHAQFLQRYEVLMAHPFVAEPEFVKPEVDPIVAAYSDAREKAAAHEYQAATQDLSVLRHDLKDALDVADDCAAFEALLAQSKSVLATLPADAGFAIEKLREDAEDARAMLPEAINLRRDGQVNAAEMLLNQIPGAVADILAEKQFANDFNARAKRAEGIQAHLASGFGTDVQSLIAGDLEESRAKASAAEADAARGAYRSAADQMAAVLRALADLEKTARDVQVYSVARAAFASRLEETKKTEGREAIEPYYQALLEDEARRASAEGVGDFQNALACCLRLKDQHTAKMREAQDAERYLDRKLEFDVAMATLPEDAGGEEARGAATALQTQAVAASVRGNWLGAANLLDTALLNLERIEATADTLSLIAGVQNGPDAVVLKGPGDFDRAFAGFEKVLNHVNGLDEEALFMDGLIDAELKARSAEDDIASDPKAAQATLNEAMDDCKDIASAIAAAAGFDQRVAATQRFIQEAEAAGVPPQDMDAARQAVAAAEEMTQDAAPDFAGAFARLEQAEEALRLAMEAQLLSAETLNTARASLEQALSLYQRADVAPYLQTQAAEVQALLDGMNADFAARKLGAAEEKAARANSVKEAALGETRACAEGVGVLERVLDTSHPACTEDAREVARLCQAAVDALTAGAFADGLAQAKAAQILSGKAAHKATEFDTYLPRKLAAQEQLAALTSRAVFESGPAYEGVATLLQSLARAEDAENIADYAAAARHLVGFSQASADVARQLDTYDRALLVKTRAEAALQQVNANRTPEIEPIFARLEHKAQEAGQRMEAFDSNAATALYQEVSEECASAEETLADLTGFAQVVDNLGALQDDDTQALIGAIAGARLKLETLKTDPSALYAPDEIAEADGLLDDAMAAADRDFSAARIDLEAAVARCGQIAVLMAQFNYMERMFAKVRGIAADLIGRHDLRREEDHKDYALQDIIARMAMLDTAVGAARASSDQRAQTQLDIEETIATLRDLRPVMDKHLAYVRERTPVDRDLYELERGPQRQLIRDHLRLARRHLDVAGTRADERSHRAAREEITAATLQLDMARLRIKIATNDRPGPEDIKPLLNAPEGMESLDVTVNALDPEVQREVMGAVFEARFGCKLEPKQDAKDRIDLPPTNIARFYKAMGNLPPSDSMAAETKLTFLELSGIGQGAGKAVVSVEGDASAVGADRADVLRAQLGDVDANAALVAGREMSAMGWNALRAAGQAVDAKLGFMKANGERLAGWVVFGNDLHGVAKEIAEAFEYDAGDAAAHMGGVVRPMPDPVGCDAEEWRNRRDRCFAFIDRARASNRPWTSASTAAACAIGAYTYVESTAGNWAKYRTDARQYAVSGTQFRGPDDWFAELYAACHAGRLRDSHPHRAEIEQL